MPAELLLMGAIIFEVLGTVLMKLSHGFEVLWASIFMIVAYSLSFVSLTFCIKKMEVSVAYAIWAALGTVLVAFIGVFSFGEKLTLGMAGCLCLIILGVAVLGFRE